MRRCGTLITMLTKETPPAVDMEVSESRKRKNAEEIAAAKKKK